MARPSRVAVMNVTFAVLVTMHVGEVWGADAAQPSWNPQAAASYLDGRAEWWLKWSGAARGQGTACLSCHTTVPYALARTALAEPLGETTRGVVEKKLIDVLQKRVANWEKIVAAPSGKDPFVPFYSGNRKPSALGTESVVSALILVNDDVRRAKGVLSAASMSALAQMWQQQQENGAWLWLDFGLNPWEKDGAYYGASLAALAVGSAGKSYYDRPDVVAKVVALKKYLRTQSAGQPLHHRVVALWASSRLPGFLSAEERTKLIKEIESVQEADGGWRLARLGKQAPAARDWPSHGGFPNGMVSDGYATGLVVLALKRAGVAAVDPHLHKGVAWLVASQKDGAWPASYLNKTRDPNTDTGKFMRDAATAFAVLALTEPK